MDEIKERLDQVRENIQKACGRAGRNPAEVNVIAVTKYVDVETTRRVLDVGLTDIGESRAQEAVPKWEELGSRAHGIYRPSPAQQSESRGGALYICSLTGSLFSRPGIEQPFGSLGAADALFHSGECGGGRVEARLKPEEVIDFAREAAELPWLQLAGLMTMAPFTEDPEEVRPVFRQLRGLQQEIRKLGDSRLNLPTCPWGCRGIIRWPSRKVQPLSAQVPFWWVDLPGGGEEAVPLNFMERVMMFFGINEEEGQARFVTESDEEQPSGVRGRGNVVSLHTAQKQVRVMLAEPRSFDEVQNIADYLKNNRTTVVSLQRLPKDEAFRVIDF